MVFTGLFVGHADLGSGSLRMYKLSQEHRPHDTVTPDELDAVTEILRLAVVAAVAVSDPEAQRFAAAKRDLMAKQMVRAYGGLEDVRSAEIKNRK